MDILQILTYVAGAILVIFLARKMLQYWTMPMHVRWELYPIPHEGKAWGGSFYEELDHWRKERHKDHVSQYAFMIPEILFIKALHEDNRPLWRWTFPFHFGLYLCIGGLAFMVLMVLLNVFFGLETGASSLMSLLRALMMVFAVAGFILGTIGVIGLLIKRLTDPLLKDFTNPPDFLNLIWLGAIFITGILVWYTDPNFQSSREFLAATLTFTARPELSAVQIINLLLFLGFIAYFPFTHMTHMISKYFMWDKVKWDDSPNVGDPGMDAKIKTYLSYPVSWSAVHIGSEGGGKTWADVATANPWEKKDEEK
jgi:nitrate reductase gamma subunit